LGNGSSNIDDHGSWTKNVSKVSDVGSLASRLQQYIDSIAEESYNSVRKKGNLPSYIQERIDEILKPPQIPYYQLISKLVKGSRLTKQKRAYTRINKKRVYTFFIDKKNLPIISPFPGKTKDFSFNISVVLDTSGSMRKDDVLEGLSGIKNMIENDKYCKTTALEIDTVIQKEYEIKKIKDIDFSIKGRGGTILLPALIRCKELNTDVTLVFTDGGCDNINLVNRRMLPKKIIYVLTKDGNINMIDKTGYIVRLPK
jgi:predicted metal-dependent peptidase